MKREQSTLRWGRTALFLAIGGLVASLTSGVPALEGGAAPASNPPGEAEAAEASHAAESVKLQAAIIPINETISELTKDSMIRRIEAARETGAKIVIFEIDTPGGEVLSALDICDYIKSLSDLKTVAWVRHKAYSAGSMIAVACDEIVMTRSSKLGDCQPIYAGPEGASSVPDDLRAKVESPILEQFRDSAVRRGYDKLLCQAMVKPELEVYWIENRETGQRRFVTKTEKVELLGERDPQAKPSWTDRLRQYANTTTPWALVKTYDDPISGKEVEIHQPIVGENELLTMSQGEAHAFGFCKAIVSDEEGLMDRYSIIGRIPRIDYSWSERMVEWLTSPIVRGILLVLMLLGAYVEFHTPGVGVPGLVALICLALFLGAPYTAGLANVWEIVIVVLGIVLLAVELFVIPGFGIAGIAGLALIFVGLLATFIPEDPGQWMPIRWPSTERSWEGVKTGITVLGSSLAGSLVAMVLLSRFLPKLPVVSRIIADNPTAAQVAVSDAYCGLAQVGDVGVCEGALRPCGKARFGATLVDVMSDGDYVDNGSRVEVVQRRGDRVIVRRYYA